MSTPKRPTYQKFESGLIMPCSTPIANYQSAVNYTPSDDDIFICTYPKCGTTWMQNILYLLRNKGVPISPEKKVENFIPHIELDGADIVCALERPRILKTHLPYELVPKNSKAKYIYVARNPKDCCVSFYHHTKGFPKHYNFLDGTFDDFFELFLLGEVDFNDFFDNLLSYYNKKNDSNVLFILYEEMKTNIEECIRQLGSFLGGIFQEHSKDPYILKEVVRHSTFESMKATPSKWSSERAEDCASFIRKGEVGDWKTVFSDEQSQRMDRRFSEKLNGTGAEFLWEKFNC